MSHEPPVPPGNQSPYPIVEPPHEHPPEPPTAPAIEEAPAPRGKLIGGALAALGLAALGGLAARAFAHEKPKAKKRGKKR